MNSNQELDNPRLHAVLTENRHYQYTEDSLTLQLSSKPLHILYPICILMDRCSKRHIGPRIEYIFVLVVSKQVFHAEGLL